MDIKSGMDIKTRVDGAPPFSSLASPADVGSLLESLGRADGSADAATRVVEFATQETGARWAEVVVPRRDGRLTILASTDAELTRELIRAVRESREGPPTPSCELGVERIVIEDLAADTTWPAFSALAQDRTPVRSAILQFLVVGGRYAAVLPVYHDEPGFFTAPRQRAVSTLGRVAGLALAGLAAAEESSQLSAALDSNRLIATAVGLMMAKQKLSRLAAYERLKAASQRSNIKMRDLAASIIANEATG
jgi:GAF domain-containing protein